MKIFKYRQEAYYILNDVSDHYSIPDTIMESSISSIINASDYFTLEGLELKAFLKDNKIRRNYKRLVIISQNATNILTSIPKIKSLIFKICKLNTIESICSDDW